MEATNDTVLRTNTFSASSPAISKGRVWTAAIIGGLMVAFFVFDGVTKLLRTEATVRGSEQLGIPVEATPLIGALLLICTAIYVIPATRILGAVLLTGYLGGAVFAHVRVGNGAFPLVFTAAFGALVWAVVALREPRLLRLIFLQQWPAGKE
jgi:hypothetical protein